MTYFLSGRNCTRSVFEKKKLTICRKTDIITEQIASVAQSVVHLTRNEKVACSSQVTSSRKRKTRFRVFFLFQLNPPLRVGEILLCNVKFSLRSGEIAAAVGGFNFTFCVSKIFHQRRMPLISPCVSTISLIPCASTAFML